MPETRIYSRLASLRVAKEEKEKRKLTYATIQQETGIAQSTLVRLFGFEPIERIGGDTLTTLCEYFSCTPGDILEYRQGGILLNAVRHGGAIAEISERVAVMVPSVTGARESLQ